MKRRIKFLLFIIVASTVCVLSACAKSPDKKESYTLEYIAQDGGRIAGETVQTVLFGENADTVFAIPNEGYIFSSWSDGSKNAERRDSNVTSDLSVTARFDKIRVCVRYGTSGGGKIVNSSGDTVFSIQVDWGGDAEAVTAVADDGYAFVCWSDGVTTSERRDTDIKSEIEVKAMFSRTSYVLKYTAGNGGKIMGELNQTVTPNGSGAAVTAVPDVGYKFMRWSDDRTSAPERKDSSVNRDINVVAEFATVRKDGLGTTENPLPIESYDDFTAIKNEPNLHYRLAVDLDLEGKMYKPPFGDKNKFTGIFDGGGHAIKNMTVTYGEFPSLFGIIGTGEVKNLILSDFVINSDSRCIGGLAYKSSGNIKNVNAVGRITVMSSISETSSASVGGLVTDYSGDGTEIDGCTVNVTIDDESKTAYAGGLARRLSGNVTVKNCSVESYISARLAGGFAYVIDGARAENCRAFGSVNVQFGGGFCYEAKSAEFYRCGSSVAIIGLRSVAGFAMNADDTTFDQCYSDGGVTSEFMSAGFVFGGSGMRIKNCLAASAVAVTNEDANAATRTLVGGFAGLISQSVIENCCVLSTVRGVTVTVGMPDNFPGSLVGAFAAQLRDVTVENCHMLKYAGSFADAAVARNTYTETAPKQELNVYESKTDMTNVADELNEGEAELSWKIDADGLPALIWVE